MNWIKLSDKDANAEFYLDADKIVAIYDIDTPKEGSQIFTGPGDNDYFFCDQSAKEIFARFQESRSMNMISSDLSGISGLFKK